MNENPNAYLSPSVLYSRDDVMRPGREDLLLHGVGDLVVVAEPDGRPRSGIQPEDVAEPLLLRVQALDRRRAEAVHVADQWQAWISNVAREYFKRYDFILSQRFFRTSSMMNGQVCGPTLRGDGSASTKTIPTSPVTQPQVVGS